MKMNKYISLFFVLILLVSCDKSVYYEKNHDISNEDWFIENELNHELEIRDTMDIFNMFFHIRNSVDYGYSNLFLFVKTTFPNGQMSRDTLECILADKSGKWYGKGRGKYRDSKILFKPQVRFPLQGVYKIDVQQAMREEPLKGIANVGISLEFKN
jgi:gliding motility-associated lipoprotein GldH